MKAAAFEYVRPTTVAEACAHLAADPDARPIAGGQTLAPMMAMRLARPSVLVDISRLPELHGITLDGDTLVIGAATRQAQAEHDRLVATHAPLLALALPWVGHTATRNRGTLGGSVANADPAAEIPLVLTALSGFVTLRTSQEQTTLPAHEFFQGPMMTAAPEGGLVTALRFPVWRETRLGAGFHEISARQGDFAYVAAAAQVALDDNGRCVRCAIAIGAATPTPIRLEKLAQAMCASELSDAELRAAVEAEVATLEIVVDAYATQTWRRRVAATLATRALLDARNAARARGAQA